MPLAGKTYARTTAVLLFVALAALLVILGASFWLAERAQSELDETVRYRAIRSAAADLLSAMQDAETGQRGYVITEDPAFLAPYDEAVGQFDERLSDLVSRLAGSPEETERINRLSATLKAKLEELEQSVALVRAGRVAEARRQVRDRVGMRLMEQARSDLQDVLAAAEHRLQSAIDDQRANARALRWTTIIGAAVIVLVILGAAIATLQYTRALAASRAEVELLNVGLEERVKERTEDLIRANDEVQRFAYIVTHDLRAPLVNIMGFTSELEAALTSIQAFVLGKDDARSEQTADEARRAASEDLPEAIGFIRTSTKKMDALINAILKISRDGRRPLKPEQIDLSELLNATADSMYHQVADEDGKVTVDMNVPPVVSDRLSLEQIFGNLLDNASKYRSPDRPLDVKVKGSRSGRDRIVVELADNGRGIAPQDHQRVFDLFRRSGSQDRPGEGIGLAHVRTLVRNLGGDIKLASELGQGTTFTIMLPSDLRTVRRSTTS